MLTADWYWGAYKVICSDIGRTLVTYSLFDEQNNFNHEARRTRKLLLHKKEILKITNKLKEGGLTVVPTKMYFSGSKAKLEIALAKGKKLYDKRNDLKEKAAKRDIEKSLKNYY